VTECLMIEYQEFYPLERSEIERLLGNGHESAMVETILSAAVHDPDWQWAQNPCLHCLDPHLKRNAMTGFSHIAHIHGKLDTDVVILRLERSEADRMSETPSTIFRFSFGSTSSESGK